jgi:SAM-dependent methyltransferase
LPRDEVFQNGRITLAFASRTTGRPFREELNSYYPEVDGDAVPLPDVTRMTRVHGGTEVSSFRLEGYSAYVKLEAAVERHFGKRFSDFASVLDWGCGCGRVTRYFHGKPCPALTGVDIDRDTIAWCQEAMPAGVFQPVPLRPPTSLESSAFDLIVGVSVFTHLAEDEQHRWLDELRRICVPGGVVLMSTHGAAAICRAALDPALVERWTSVGFVDKYSPALRGIVTRRSYYRDSFHSPNYLRREWRRYFDIVDVIPALIGNHQDLVVMRRPL